MFATNHRRTGARSSGPTTAPPHRALASLDAAGQAALEADLLALLDRMNRGGADTLVVPSEYLEEVVVVTMA